MSNKLKYVVVLYLSVVTCLITSYAFSQAYDTGSSGDKQPGFTWPEGNTLAISLTFDDARLLFSALGHLKSSSG